MNIQVLKFNAFLTNSYVAWDETGECAIFDPAAMTAKEVRLMDGFIEREKLRPVAVLLTHGHGDHIGAVSHCIAKWGIPVYMKAEDRPISIEHAKICEKLGLGKLDAEFPFIDVHEEDKVKVGNHEFIAIETPGHTPGGLCWLCIEESVLFSGDTLFRGSIGRTDMPGGDYDRLMESIRGKLLGLDGKIDVLPGHGPCTTIADEVQSNPFLAPINEQIDMEEAASHAIEPTIGK